MPNHANYDALVTEGLDRAYDRAKAGAGLEIDLGTARVIVFSDLHRGNRRRSDDFLACEPTFREALGHYLAEGYLLVVLGDAEDLWKYRPREVKRAYEASIALEGSFSEAGRYLRLVGNHDDLWKDGRAYRRYLGDLLGQVDPLDGICLHLSLGAEELGTIFLTHGHQGTLDSDRFSWLSRLLLRFIYRPFQQLTGFRTTSPSTSIELRDQHSLAMYRWSEDRCGQKLVFVAGHTHLPVFLSLNHVEQLQVRRHALLHDLVARGLHATVEEASRDEGVRQVEAEIEAVQGKMGGVPPSAAGALAKKPCYFNTGCCSFSDGDITGIEITGREISLVRWKLVDGRGSRAVRARSDLVDDVFAKL